MHEYVSRNAGRAESCGCDFDWAGGSRGTSGKGKVLVARARHTVGRQSQNRCIAGRERNRRGKVRTAGGCRGGEVDGCAEHERNLGSGTEVDSCGKKRSASLSATAASAEAP